ncbi:glycosyltransferase family 39 protein [Flavobacterium sp. MK4S-17]|uniref:ArnT family glycosyltransferase n=1 Tax=Flavobacterium sp. MK4S-17 TaxID=2543737 RepID=UPI00135BDCC5|nr:glycosyltransferase family 39 protein [Flavobacterium sp. MK4S-17]
MKRLPNYSFKQNILIATLLFSAVIVSLVEVLSLFNSLNLYSVATFWAVFLLLTSIYLFKTFSNIKSVIAKKVSTIKGIYNSLNLINKILLWVIIAMMSLLLFQGIIYPPNNWDSLSYHMSRIMFWLGNESVNHFPTFILRHLYQPPLAEYYILNINLLNGNDYFANSVQWLFLLLTILASWSVLEYFKVSWNYKILNAFLIVTIPSVLLQASTTKNDIVCSFFIITSIYFCLKAYYIPAFRNFIFLGMSAGFAFFTKGTGYMFMAPVLIIFSTAIVIQVFSTHNFKSIYKGLAAIIIIILINAGLYIRNYNINHNILTIDEIEGKMYSNDKMNAKLLLSNIIKNSGLHLGYPIGEKSDEFIRDLHKKLNIDINDGATNYNNANYQLPVNITTHEDLVPNLIHYILTLLSCIALLCFMLRYKKNKLALLFGLTILLQIIFFCGYLKWQPWHTRLHIPIFILSTILITVVSMRIKWYRYIVFATLPLLAYGFYFNCFYNNIRPIIKSPYTLNLKPGTNRYKKYFANQLHLYDDYVKIADMIYNDMPEKMGITLGDWEYPLFTNFYYNHVKLVTLQVDNVTKKIPQDISNIDCIVTGYNKSSININDTVYINQTPENNHIWYYKK